MENKISNWKKYTFYIFFLYFTFSPLLDYVLPIKVAGVSLFNSFLPSIVTIALYLIQFGVIKNKDHIILLVLTFVAFLIFLVQMATFNDDTFDKTLVARRYIFLTPLYVVVIKSMIEQLDIKILVRIVMVSLIFCSITGILYLWGLPTIRILNQETNADDYGRFGGMWVGANVFASILSLQLIIVFFYYRQFYNIKILLFSITFIGILSSISRGATLQLLILMPFIFRQKYNLKNYILDLLLITISFFWITSISISSHLTDYVPVFDRLQENDQSRSNIFLIYSAKLLESPFNLVFGAPSSIQSTGSVQFSDNSFLLLVLDNGIILAFTYAASVFTLIWERGSFMVYLMTAILILTYFTNNALLWNYYVFLSVLTFILVSKNYFAIKKIVAKDVKLQLF